LLSFNTGAKSQVGAFSRTSELLQRSTRMLLKNMRMAICHLLRSPSFSLTAVLIVAFGIDAMTTISVGQQTKRHRSFADCDKAAKTQAELNECGSNDYKLADDELNATYQELLKKTAADPTAVAKIREAQRAWVAYRSAQISSFRPALHLNETIA
jgi:uncharacterized protein YecT (DUF1311 family)